MDFITQILESGESLPLTAGEIITALMAALAAGTAIYLSYRFSSKGRNGGSFHITLILMPAIVAALIMLIGSDVARAFSLAGAFSIIRFRSSPGDPRDIAFVLFTMAAGLAAGMGLPLYAMLITLILCAAVLVLHALRIGSPRRGLRELQITVAEDMDYASNLPPVLERFAEKIRLVRVRTASMGSLYVLDYELELRDENQVQELIDELRIRNGNMNISIHLPAGQY